MLPVCTAGQYCYVPVGRHFVWLVSVSDMQAQSVVSVEVNVYEDLAVSNFQLHAVNYTVIMYDF